jgi:hypothetical protein
MEYECKSGNRYGLVTAYGVLCQLEGSIFEMVSDETLEKMKAGMSQIEDVEDMETEFRNRMFDQFSSKDLREFLLANIKQGPEVLATVLRTKNGTSIGDLKERKRFIMEDLDYTDGAELTAYIDGLVRDVQKGRADSVGKSRTASEGESGTVLIRPSPQ